MSNGWLRCCWRGHGDARDRIVIKQMSLAQRLGPESEAISMQVYSVWPECDKYG